MLTNEDHATWSLKAFQQLSIDELYEIIKLRIDIFIVEQNCPYPELDNLDRHPQTLHLFKWHKDKIISYLRILPKGLVYKNHVAIGRVLVAKAYRQQRLGHLLLDKALSVCHDVYTDNKLKLSAQYHLAPFYQQHGFICVERPYLEDGIKHIAMVRS